MPCCCLELDRAFFDFGVAFSPIAAQRDEAEEEGMKGRVKVLWKRGESVPVLLVRMAFAVSVHWKVVGD